jgi:hypothetical protein
MHPQRPGLGAVLPADKVNLVEPRPTLARVVSLWSDYSGLGCCCSSARFVLPWIIIVLAAIPMAGTLAYMHRNALRWTRKIGVPATQPELSFRGNMRSRHGGSTSGYWARMEFFDWGICLRSAIPGGLLLPVLEIRYEELTDAQLVETRTNNGVRFQSGCLPGPVTFVTFEDSRSQIIDRLERRGVRVNRQVEHIRWPSGEHVLG